MTPGARPPAVLDVVRAAARIAPHLAPTPIVRAGPRSAWLKLENLQVTGAYKVRGALNALAAQLERGDGRPVVAASAGNHALGVAWAARRLGLRACVVVPSTAPQTKIRGAARLGAEVIRAGDCFEAAFVRAQELALENDWRFLHAFDDPDVIAGQGTVALELLHFEPDAVLIPIGGGGLASGMGLVLKAHGIPAWGVQVERVDGMARLLGGEDPIEPARTVADGLRVVSPGRLTAAICATVLEGVLRVTEDEVRSSILDLAETHRVVAEGAGAVAAAALDRVPGKRKIALVSGGNIDLSALAALVAAGRASAYAEAAAF
jgi:threonine dehydratase